MTESKGMNPAAAFVQRSLETVANRPGLPRQFVHVLQVTIVGLRKSQLPRMAAALAYRTIFGLIPVLVIGVIVLAAFSSENEVRTLLHKTISFAGLDQVSLDRPPAQDESAFFDRGPASTDAAAASSGPLGVEDWITGVIDRGRKLNFGAVGAIGALTLIYAALSMLVEIEKAFNQIYNAPEG
ncbi:MAG: YhjD/YihY/BrkB family envelope integrity protein, partial [bacterium]|nr:YhjD/YihY/BrkB family envelope integrity protein [bacterium]